MRLTITARIWLSVGVFIGGYVVSTALGQIQGLASRKSLQGTAQGLFPAAQRSQEAEAAFQRVVKEFGDAVIMQDASGLDRASEDGRLAVAALQAIAAIPGLPPGRSDRAAALAASLDQLLVDARSTYGAVLSNNLAAASQEKMGALATRTEETRSALATAKEQFASDLRQQLTALQDSTARQSMLALGVFVGTLVVAGIVVHLTIRRSITGPVVRVVAGVQAAAEQASHTSVQMAQSGQELSGSAQQQAACMEGTASSLEEISTTTRQNADRAGEADRLMQEAQNTTQRASAAMAELTASMNLISNSSNQVAGVLRNIDEIAFHTNILALNAAVEAARAGEAGAGFSVVADEVRSLAHRAADAARNSGAIIEKTVEDVSRGVALVTQAHSAFEAVAANIAKGTRLVSQIAASSSEQARGIATIGDAIQRVETLTNQYVGNAQRTAQGAAAMSSQVENTRKYLGELAAIVGVE